MASSRAVGESGAPVEETEHLLQNEPETEEAGVEGLIQNSPGSSATGENLLVNDQSTGDITVNEVPANSDVLLAKHSPIEEGVTESNENIALLAPPPGNEKSPGESNLDNPAAATQLDHVGNEEEGPCCGNLMLVKPDIHDEDFRFAKNGTGSGANTPPRDNEWMMGHTQGADDRATNGMTRNSDETGNTSSPPSSSPGKVNTEVENTMEEEEEEEEDGENTTTHTKPLLQNDGGSPLIDANADLSDAVAMDTMHSPSTPSADLDEVFMADGHVLNDDKTFVTCSGTVGNNEPRPHVPDRNQLKPLPIVKDHLTVKMNVGPKLSDASTDELSDVEEELEYRGRPWYKQCRKSRACCISLYFWVIILFLGSIAAMATVGILVVDNYRRAELFKGTFCSGYQSHDVGERIKCSCGKGCTSDYRCIDVIVRYTDLIGDTHTFGLRDNEAMIGRQVSGKLRS